MTPPEKLAAIGCITATFSLKASLKQDVFRTSALAFEMLSQQAFWLKQLAELKQLKTTIDDRIEGYK